MEAETGETLIVVKTGAAVTVILEEPVTVIAPLLALAVIVAVPAPTPLTKPLAGLTVATAALSEDQVIVTPATGKLS